MNFAYINGLTHYHTQLDNLENVDARTLQHHGASLGHPGDGERSLPGPAWLVGHSSV